LDLRVAYSWIGAHFSELGGDLSGGIPVMIPVTLKQAPVLLLCWWPRRSMIGMCSIYLGLPHNDNFMEDVNHHQILVRRIFSLFFREI
jgi:hypothetical protein